VARRLDVYLHEYLVGLLEQDDRGDINFQYAESWLAAPNTIPLSQSLPFRTEPFSRRECAGFFGGILPEGEKREVIARNLGVSARNDFAMLAEIGGECAGAVTFIPSGTGLPPEGNSYRLLTDAELAQTLRRLPRRPLLAGEEHMRLSLTGAQDKLAVRIDRDQLFLPLDGAPSTHILKPAIELYPGIVRNEWLCTKLARAVGLPAANVEMRVVEEIDYLAVERYDRSQEAPAGLERIHQEDFCQAMGLIPENKYQAEGGPSFSTCVELLRQACTTPAVEILRFTDAFIFNFLVGNNDAHGKNFSLLYMGWPGHPLRTSLAPLYDLVCTGYYPQLSPRMAMKIGGEYRPDRVYPRHLEELAAQAKLNKSALKRRAAELARLTLSRLPDVTPQDRLAEEIAEFIRRRCQHVVEMFGR
jgi:serine/threonine-protein kinase HipA